ncbi:MAG TPA: ABC transporter transmembrane domain-containing protein, partial [Mycobacteriales bacterium]|nr:ABC transporter transmembrane domain-containing protein [Mycobacteriales bacterium]
MSRAVFRIAIGNRRRDLALASAAMTSHQICEALVPVLIGLIIDHAVDHGRTGRLLGWLAGLLVLFIVLSYSYRFGARWLRKAVKGSEHDLRMSLIGRILDPHGLAPAPPSGELLNLATNDAQRVSMINMAIAMSASAVGALAVAAVFLLRVSVPMGLLILLGMPPLLWLLHRLAAPLTARGSAEQEGIARATAVATDVLRGLRVVKGIGSEAVAIDRYRRASEQSLASTIRSV